MTKLSRKEKGTPRRRRGRRSRNREERDVETDHQVGPQLPLPHQIGPLRPPNPPPLRPFNLPSSPVQVPAQKEAKPLESSSSPSPRFRPQTPPFRLPAASSWVRVKNPAALAEAGEGLAGGVREGSSDGEGKKVDPRCPNAANPFHVCTNHCLAKMVEGGRSSEGGKSPISLFSRHSGRSTSSSEDGSVKSGGSKKADPKCPNAGNPFHECGEHCTVKMKELEKQKKADKKSPRKKGGKDGAVVQNWKVDPRCPNAGNPFHICAQYCFDHLNEAPSTPTSKPDSRKGKAVMKAEPTGEINPDCVNASNPYHKCGEYCKRNGNR
ncbi:hypothetical protein TRIUR3_09943 [Triticum urartu]|uniref:Uncharacterized protein n=1 Tax=Triticum urartu TaxID=4572 RepID=M7ZP64_TRIUA|nr:hypothetical protein TRIUR3_09943 [Triticum urartu]